MKIHTLSILAALALATTAQAGQVGAGPGGTASTTVGSIVSSVTQAQASSGTPQPGIVGSVTLPTNQVASIAAYLQGQQGAVVSGNTITVPTTFADNTRGTVSIDTGTGVLTLTRT